MDKGNNPIPILEAQGVSLRFGGLTAVNNVSLKVMKGEIYSIIGPNGAGKSSLFNTISGIYKPSDGEIFLNQKAIRSNLSVRVIRKIMAFSMTVGFSFLLFANLNSLWSTVITEQYHFGESFSWKAALVAGAQYLTSAPLSWTVLPASGGFLLSLFATILYWQNMRSAANVVASHGIGRTFQNIRLFEQLTLNENIAVGMHRRLDANFWENLLHLPHFFRDKHRISIRAKELLAFVGLDKSAETLAGNLSYGEQRRLEIARALALSPSILMLDEPAAGMNPTEKGSLMELIQKIRSSGVTVLLIEHDMKVVMGISDRIAVLDYGHKIAEGTADEVRNDPKVRAAYLGEGGA